MTEQQQQHRQPVVLNSPGRTPGPNEQYYYYYGSPYYGADPHGDHGLLGSLHPLRVLRVLRRKWKAVLLALLVAIAGGWFYLSTSPKVYRASGEIEMAQRRPRYMPQPGGVIEDNYYTPAEETFNTRLRTFSSTAARQLAFERFKMLWKARDGEQQDLETLFGTASFTLVPKTRISASNPGTGEGHGAVCVPQLSLPRTSQG